MKKATDMQPSLNFEEGYRHYNEISKKYFFANTRKYAIAGEDDEEPYGRFDDELYEAFKKIVALSLDRAFNGKYFLTFYCRPGSADKADLATWLTLGHQNLALEHTGPLKAQLSDKCRPLLVGCSIGHVNQSTYGSLGCVVEKDQVHYLLSAGHVIPKTGNDDFVIQPGKPKGTDRDIITEVYLNPALDPHRANTMDVALAGPIKPNLHPTLQPFDHVADDVFVFKGDRITEVNSAYTLLDVTKIGASSSETTGVLKSVLGNIELETDYGTYLFKDQMLIASSKNELFSAPGDSGAIIFNKTRECGIGLLIGGSGSFAVATPLSTIFSRHGLRLYCR